jgi:hypothetical protein
MGEMRSMYTIVDIKLEGKRHLRRVRHRWEDSIKTNLKETKFEGVDWSHLTQDRDQWLDLVNTVMTPQVL